ncbi:hypothetical protein EDC96DRAFT_523086 [Choanephora cucurbitarum]|nr:hypothetical protein EDC96DRAFT_523086 [Choanephora cucurbitarum]
MSFKIPGYFLDQKTKKLYRIQPHGPFSLPELRKRVEREEAEAALKGAGPSASKARPLSTRKPPNLQQFLFSRTTRRILSPEMGFQSLMAQLRPRSRLQLQERKVMQNRMFVELIGGPGDLGEMFIANHQTLLSHYGYQLDPQFSVWQVSQWRNNHSFMSLHLSNRMERYDGQIFQTLIGTLGGSLRQFVFPKLPPIQQEDARQAFLDEEQQRITTPQGNTIPSFSSFASYGGYEDMKILKSFERKKDLFWSSCIHDLFNQTVIGGDQKVYLLDSDIFRPIYSQKIESSIFATHISDHRPFTSWLGQRNGRIQLMDSRDPRARVNITRQFSHSSSVIYLQGLSDSTLLSSSLNGSVHLWDIRGAAKPVRTLKGHVNESTFHLGTDFDSKNQLLMLSGNDGRVRIWSLNDTHRNDPIWTSSKFDVPVPAVKFMCNTDQYPRLQDCWSSILPDTPIASRQIPGVLLFGTTDEASDATYIEWMTAVN